MRRGLRLALERREPGALLAAGAIVVLAAGILVLVYLNFLRPAPAEDTMATLASEPPTPGMTPQPEVQSTVTAPPQEPVEPAASPSEGEGTGVLRLLFAAVDSDAFVVERRRAEPASSPAERARQAMEALLAGSRRGYPSSIPSGTRLREVYRGADGVYYLDLSREVRTQHPGGSREELQTVYALVGTLLANVPEARAVRLLLQGREEATLVGHVDISRPLTMQMLADVVPSEEPP